MDPPPKSDYTTAPSDPREAQNMDPRPENETSTAISGISEEIQQPSGDTQTPRIIIALSGPPSSGKTTIASLLYAVFAPSHSEKSTSSSGCVPILRQDDYFVDKMQCPVVYWQEAVHSKLKEGAARQLLVGNSTRAVQPNSVSAGPHPLMQLNTNQSNGVAVVQNTAPPNPGPPRRLEARDILRFRGDTYLSQATLFNPNFGISPSLVMANDDAPNIRPCYAGMGSIVAASDPEQVVVKTKNCCGPNADCRHAVDWARFSTEIISMHSGAECRHLTRWQQEDIDRMDGSIATMSSTAGKGQRLLKQLRERVQRWVLQTAKKNKQVRFAGQFVVDGKMRELGIVEGFLLFLDPRPCTQEQAQGAESGMERLMRLFETKLFLPVGKEMAANRRFKRISYIDIAQGGKKQPDETWKTRGYFDKVAWVEYIKEHRWLFQNGNVEMVGDHLQLSPECAAKEIWVRPDYGSSIDNTLLWAVEVILMDLEFKEDAARLEFMIKQEKEASQEVQTDQVFGNLATDLSPMVEGLNSESAKSNF